MRKVIVALRDAWKREMEEPDDVEIWGSGKPAEVRMHRRTANEGRLARCFDLSQAAI
jgi:hypothetical protein